MSPDQPIGIGRLAAALSKAQAEYQPLKKSKTAKIKMKSGGEYSYKYADLADMLECTRAALGKNGLAITQLINGSILETKLIHESGESLESTADLPTGISAQEYGSAITYLRRYTLGPMLGIASEEDDDGAQANESGAAMGTQTRTQRPQTITPAQVAMLYTTATRAGWTHADVHAAIGKQWGISSANDIPADGLNELIDYIKRYPRTAKPAQAPTETKDDFNQ